MRISMPTVARIIEAHGGMEALRQRYIRLVNPPFMRLVIEAIGPGPNGLPAISVAHYYEQNADAMRDPELVFEVGLKGWEPVSFQQDNLAVYLEVYSSGTARRLLAAQLNAFARIWDQNILAQGFLAVKSEV